MSVCYCPHMPSIWAHMWHVTLGSGCPPRHPRNRKGAQLAVYENFIETQSLLAMLFASDISASARTHADTHFANSLSFLFVNIIRIS